MSKTLGVRNACEASVTSRATFPSANGVKRLTHSLFTLNRMYESDTPSQKFSVHWKKSFFVLGTNTHQK